MEVERERKRGGRGRATRDASSFSLNWEGEVGGRESSAVAQLVDVGCLPMGFDPNASITKETRWNAISMKF